MDRDELIERTMTFAVRVLNMVDRFPRTIAGRTIGAQIARSATSVAANYRAALRGKSRADFIAKITTVLEEGDEREFWIEVTKRAELLRPEMLAPLQTEAGELVRIFSATRATAKNRQS